jgi:hypothetical protein
MPDRTDEIKQVLGGIEKYLKQEQELYGDLLYRGDGGRGDRDPSPTMKPKSTSQHEPEEIDLFGNTTKSEIPVTKSSLHQQQPYPNEPWTTASSVEDLDRQICTCLKCPLGKTRTNFVFGVGSSNADVVVIGEAPGADEDAQGEPFVGRAGQLLNKIL